ncbi:MAG: ribonuclease HII, partial [Emergencia timonensis]
MKKAEREIFLKNRLEELKTIENQLRAEGFQYIAGVDEVGRGPLAGPVVAAAVVLPADFDVLGVDDSKKLSEKKRNELFDAIIEKAVCYGIGQKDQQVIDDINILEATKLA